MQSLWTSKQSSPMWLSTLIFNEPFVNDMKTTYYLCTLVLGNKVLIPPDKHGFIDVRFSPSIPFNHPQGTFLPSH